MCGVKSRGNWQIGSHLSQKEWDKIFRKGDFNICNNCIKKKCSTCPVMNSGKDN
jgi:hypothetical protein